jgi:hypothetical protein
LLLWPPGASSFNAAPASISKHRVKLAHTKARDMVSSCFETEEDHKCIKVAMDNYYPSIAIFMCPVVDPKQEMKRQRGNNKKDQVCKSILDVKEPSSLHCLAAVNYHQVGQKTVVLWLSTTLEEPPIDSIQHVTWRGKGQDNFQYEEPFGAFEVVLGRVLSSFLGLTFLSPAFFHNQQQTMTVV